MEVDIEGMGEKGRDAIMPMKIWMRSRRRRGRRGRMRR
jgi:hypothetical protein